MEANKQYTATKTVEGVACECAAEHSLPDYKGDLRKILFTDARIKNDETFSDGERIEMNGNVEFSVVYLDAEGEVSHCEFVGDYEMSSPCNSESFISADVTTAVQSVNVRMTGPRKLAARAVVESRISLSEECAITVSGDAFELGEPEVLEKEVKIQKVSVSQTAEKEYNELLEAVDGAIVDEVEVLYASAEGRMLGSVDERGELEGEITVNALVSCKGEQPHLVKKVLPLDGIVDIEKGSNYEQSRTLSEIKIKDLATSIDANDDGVLINVSLKASCKVYECGNITESLVKDCFLIDRETENEIGEFKYTTLAGCGENTVEIETKIPRESVGAENVRNIPMVGAKAKVTDLKIVEDSIEVSGEIRFSAMTCEINEAGAPEYQNIRFEVPFAENVKLNCQISEECRVVSDVCAFYPEILLDQASLYPSCKLYLRLFAACDKREAVVSSSTVAGERICTDESVVTVCYPAQEETLYDVAKRYHKTLVSIAADNSISESVFSMKDAPVSSLGVKKLLIR